MMIKCNKSDNEWCSNMTNKITFLHGFVSHSRYAGQKKNIIMIIITYEMHICRTFVPIFFNVYKIGGVLRCSFENEPRSTQMYEYFYSTRS